MGGGGRVGEKEIAPRREPSHLTAGVRQKEFLAPLQHEEQAQHLTRKTLLGRRSFAQRDRQVLCLRSSPNPIPLALVFIMLTGGSTVEELNRNIII